MHEPTRGSVLKAGDRARAPENRGIVDGALRQHALAHVMRKRHSESVTERPLDEAHLAPALSTQSAVFRDGGGASQASRRVEQVERRVAGVVRPGEQALSPERRGGVVSLNANAHTPYVTVAEPLARAWWDVASPVAGSCLDEPPLHLNWRHSAVNCKSNPCHPRKRGSAATRRAVRPGGTWIPALAGSRDGRRSESRRQSPGGDVS
jgi:hypothetical protein